MTKLTIAGYKTLLKEKQEEIDQLEFELRNAELLKEKGVYVEKYSYNKLVRQSEELKTVKEQHAELQLQFSKAQELSLNLSQAFVRMQEKLEKGGWI